MQWKTELRRRERSIDIGNVRCEIIILIWLFSSAYQLAPATGSQSNRNPLISAPTVRLGVPGTVVWAKEGAPAAIATRQK